VTVTLANAVAGKIPTVFVKTASGEVLVKSVGETPVSFIMPAEDVRISVVYTAEDVDYVDPDGNVQSGTKGEMKTLPDIVIEKGMSMDLTKIPAELILSGAVIDGDKLILSYQYALGENTDAQALLNALRAAITQIEYKSYFIINGAIFESAEDAMAYICEDAGFDGWSETVDKNLNFGSFEQATKETSWIWLIILAIILLLILIIVLLYVLYIKGVLKPNFFLKGIVAIVSVFFALCMALARAWLEILRLFGVDEERLVRRYPLLKKRGKRASLEESLDALRAVDPSYADRENEVDLERISEKTVSVVEELEIDSLKSFVVVVARGIARCECSLHEVVIQRDEYRLQAHNTQLDAQTFGCRGLTT
jgi:hypothetical protein